MRLFSRPALGVFLLLALQAALFGQATEGTILGLVAGVLLGYPLLGLALLGAALANRMLQALAVGWGVVRDPESARFFWLYPMRDLLGFFLWCLSFTDSTITWRGERYQLRGEGRMVPASALALPRTQEHSPA